MNTYINSFYTVSVSYLNLIYLALICNNILFAIVYWTLQPSFHRAVDDIHNDVMILNKLGGKRRSHVYEPEPNDDNSALFWQPGKKGFYAPRPGNNSVQRWNAFRNVGRFVCSVYATACKLFRNHLYISWIIFRLQKKAKNLKF